MIAPNLKKTGLGIVLLLVTLLDIVSWTFHIEFLVKFTRNVTLRGNTAGIFG